MGSVGSEPLSGPCARRRILFIDAYDSFSNNITSLLATLLDVDVFVLPIDAPVPGDVLRRELRHYDAVVCGPGPGSPERDADVGLARRLWELAPGDLVPVLGVCLGFQSLALACGARVRRLRGALHGMVRAVEHRPRDVFEGVGAFRATLYHSLCADVGQDAVAAEDWGAARWDGPPGLPDLVPLAWAEEDRSGGGGGGGGGGVERILMALRHRRKPFWGLQYHPESVCTEAEGDQVVRNWFCQARRWNLEHGRIITSPDRHGGDGGMVARNALRTSLLRQVACAEEAARSAGRDAWDALLRRSCGGRQRLERESLPLAPGVEVPDLAEALGAASASASHIILDSANGDQPPPDAGVDVRGRFSIIAADVDECLRVEHHTGDDFVTVVDGPARGARHRVPLSRGQTVWHLLAELHESRRVGLPGADVPAEDEVPFLGGLVGFVTYEQGLHDIDVGLPRDRGHARPDVCLAWVTRSVVVDHRAGVVHAQDLEGGTAWVSSAVRRLQGAAARARRGGHHRSGLDTSSSSCSSSCSSSSSTTTTSPPKRRPVVRLPERAKYEAKVRMCQEYIAAGESYELCLTDQTDITRARPAADPSWRLYRALRRRNPAPFASYVRLGGATLVSSSPERFLAHDRGGACSMKPMKGTVKKRSPAADGDGDGDGDGCATLAEAEAVLHVPKEEAENLMIVDLVRHDLHGVCGAGAVRVPELLKVEEYQTVYTMITRVEGRLPAGAGEEDGGAGGAGYYSGLDVLAASLPPGSMTGAPKRRSCEILRRVEGGRERSLYSGVVGYMCVTGRGDWSVTIRSLFRWDDEGVAAGGEEEEDGGEEVWHIGAGGAVTILSTPEGEREEMFVKLARPLSVFADDEGAWTAA